MKRRDALVELIHTYTHTYIHTHIYIHAYIHTYIHTYRSIYELMDEAQGCMSTRLVEPTHLMVKCVAPLIHTLDMLKQVKLEEKVRV